MRSVDRRRANQRGDVVKSPVADLGDVDAGAAARPEDLHQVIMHALAQYIRQSRMSADAISAAVF
jgi:hypothetical protein